MPAFLAYEGGRHAPNSIPTNSIHNLYDDGTHRRDRGAVLPGLATAPRGKPALPDTRPHGPVAADIPRQSQLHQVPCRRERARRTTPRPRDQGSSRNLPHCAIGDRHELLHRLSHQSQDDVAAPTRELMIPAIREVPLQGGRNAPQPIRDGRRLEPGTAHQYRTLINPRGPSRVPNIPAHVAPCTGNEPGRPLGRSQRLRACLPGQVSG